MKTKQLTALACIGMCMFSISCDDDNDSKPTPMPEKIHQLSAEMQTVRDYVPEYAVFAHRGTTYWAPEETEAAYRWARNIGADYLEADLQTTKDGVIIVLHDEKLTRTTNIAEVYPDRKNDPTSTFTYEELMKLDAGSWFNTTNPDRARDGYSKQHQYISTLEDLIMFAEGKRIKRDAKTGERIWSKNTDGTYKFEYEADPVDNGNRPGIYIETKEPDLNPGIEKALAAKLDQMNWNIISKPETSTEQFKDGKVNVGNTNGKVILQTFSLKSLALLKDIYQGKIPTTFLLWKGTGENDINNDDPATYVKFINYGVDNLAHFTGPSIAGEPNNYPELLQAWQADSTHKSKMKIHPYSFDSLEQMEKYDALCDGMFTNRSDLTIKFYMDKGVRKNAPALQDANTVLDNLGY